jgi:pseudouridine synthase
MIRAGRVKVNGVVVDTLGAKVDPEKDVVRVDGRQVRPPSAAAVTLMLHKPSGYVSSTRDPLGRRVVTELVGGKWGRLYPVGRLDYDATGLLLLTNDGQLAHRLMHPRYQVPRTYRVTVAGEVSRDSLGRLAAGVELDGRQVAAAVQMVKKEPEKTVLELTVWEGRYHLVKRLLAALGHPVLKLKRLAFGPLHLARLPRGAYRVLEAGELAALRREVGLK